MYQDTPINEINELLEKSWTAFHQYSKYPLSMRAKLLRTIAEELELAGDQLIQVAMKETQLPEARLRNERGRTIFQLNSYGEAAEKGHWLEARIDTADPNRNPPKPDIRKMLVPLGPVVVFGASNFPFAFSTAGGDTASALAAGCSVIVKAHPAHPETSAMAAEAIKKAVSRCGLPESIFIHVFGASVEVGKVLVTHTRTKAVGFTGSYQGGKALFDWANQRKEPIPVFAEMGSVNPVFLFPDKIHSSAAETAAMYAGSITLGVGQFCTNPGLLIGIDSEDLNLFISSLGEAIRKTQPAPMLHGGIAKTYREKKAAALAQAGNELVAESEGAPGEGQGSAAIASVSGDTFLENPLLHQEVFGPYSLVVRCRDMA